MRNNVCILYILLLFVCLIHVNTCNHVYNIGGLVPITNYGQLGVHRAAAARLAYMKIADDANIIFPNKNFSMGTYVEVDTSRNPLQASRLVFSLVSGTWTHPNTPPFEQMSTACSTLLNGSVASIGPATSSVSVAAALTGAVHGHLTVSYSATSPTLSDKSLYPYFCRVVPSDSNQAQVVFDVLEYFSWKRIAIISTSDDYGRGLPMNFLLLADAAAISYTYRTFNAGTRTVSKTNAIRVALNDLLKSRSRIILMHAVIPEAQEVMEIADEIGMSPRFGFVWLATDGWSNDNFFQSTDTSIAELIERNAMGLIGIQQRDFRSQFMNVFNPHRDEIAKYYNVTASYFDGINVYAPYAYDAVFAVAHAFDYVSKNNIDIHSVSDWTEIMHHHVSFNGITGAVSFTKECDRLPAYDIVNRGKGEGVGFVKVGSWSTGSSISFLPEPQVVFFDGTNDVPSDNLRPVVWYSQTDRVWVTVVVCLLTVVFAMAGATVWRFRDDVVLKARSPRLTQAIILGSSFGVWAVGVRVWSQSLYIQCVLPIIFFTMGVSLTFATLLGRVYRIAVLFSSNTLRSAKISDHNILIFVGSVVLYDVLIMVIIHAAAPITFALEPELSDSSQDVQLCEWGNTVLVLMCVFVIVPKLVLIGCVAYMSFKTRYVELDAFNESKTITMAVWSEMLVMLLTVAVFVAFRRHVILSLYTLSIGVCLSFFVIVFFLLAQPFLNILNQVRNVHQLAAEEGMDKAEQQKVLKTASSRRQYTKSRQRKHQLRCQTCGTKVKLPSNWSVHVEDHHMSRAQTEVSVRRNSFMDASRSRGTSGFGSSRKKAVPQTTTSARVGDVELTEVSPATSSAASDAGRKGVVDRAKSVPTPSTTVNGSRNPQEDSVHSFDMPLEITVESPIVSESRDVTECSKDKRSGSDSASGTRGAENGDTANGPLSVDNTEPATNIVDNSNDDDLMEATANTMTVCE